MFTGLVQTLGRVARLTPDGAGGLRLAVFAPDIASDLELGESVAVNGCCLTVVASDDSGCHFDCGPETLARTNLGSLAEGRGVNLERALRVGDRLGGHFVTGHIDDTGTLTHLESSGEWRQFRFALDAKHDPLLIPKGSIAVDGVSLTLVTVAPGKFSVMLIPHTLSVTTFGQLRPGDRVNLELDMLAKHVQKLVGTRGPS